MIKIILTSFFVFILFIATHFTVFYIYNPYDKVQNLLCTALVFSIIYFVFYAILPSNETITSFLGITAKVERNFVYPLVGFIFFGFLFLGYLEFYFTADRSITFRMLMIASANVNGEITKNEMFDKYDVDGIIFKRFDDLVYGGYFTVDNGVYKLTRKGYLVLNVYDAAITILNFDRGSR